MIFHWVSSVRDGKEIETRWAGCKRVRKNIHIPLGEKKKGFGRDKSGLEKDGTTVSDFHNSRII